MKYSEASVYWNYYLAIEQDLMGVSRFIEFCDDNLDTYSIELARILMVAASEVDVILKEICKPLGLTKKNPNIGDYRKYLQQEGKELEAYNDLLNEQVIIPRHNMTLIPWRSWQDNGKDVPSWWTANNKVKHHRSTEYSKANLDNALNAVSALLLATLFYICPLEDSPPVHFALETPKLFWPGRSMGYYEGGF